MEGTSITRLMTPDGLFNTNKIGRTTRQLKTSKNSLEAEVNKETEMQIKAIFFLLCSVIFIVFFTACSVPSMTSTVFKTSTSTTVSTTTMTTTITQPAEPTDPKPVITTTAALSIIKEWSGTGVKTTEPFIVSSKPWVIKWSNKLDSQGLLQVMVYKSSNPSIPITLVANTDKDESGESYVYETGEFYLMINSFGASWNITVQTQK